MERLNTSCESAIEEAVQLMEEFLLDADEIHSETNHKIKNEKRTKLKEKKTRLYELLDRLKVLEFSNEIRKRKIKSDLEKLLRTVQKDMESSGYYKMVLNMSYSLESKPHFGETSGSSHRQTPTLPNHEVVNTFTEAHFKEPNNGSRNGTLNSQTFSRIDFGQREEDIQDVADAADLIDRFAALQSCIGEGNGHKLSLMERNLEATQAKFNVGNQDLGAKKKIDKEKRRMMDQIIYEDEREDRETTNLWQGSSIISHYESKINKAEEPKKETKEKKCEPNNGSYLQKFNFCCG
jgi:hypothetical protein